ncbi:MAG TPA: hypothetical protein VK897_27640 [Anaerolineales bacterium]|nr:hypothetical protein [Anaerolineales bacterium]
MKNPFGPEQEPLPHHMNLKKRMIQRVESAKVNDQIFQVVQKAYEDALKQENIVLSRPESQRLLSQILKHVLDDMVQKLDKGTV